MLRKIVNSFFICSISFFISLYFHHGNFLLNKGYELYYGAFIISWGISSFVSRKFKMPEDLPLLNKFYTYTISFFLMLGALALIIYKYNLVGVSRFVILNSLLIYFAIEICLLFYKYRNRIKLSTIRFKYSSRAFIFESVLFGLVDLFIVNKIAGNISFNAINLLLFFEFYFSWFAGSFLSHQFHAAYRRRNYWAFIWIYIRSYIIITALSAFSAFMNRIEPEKLIYIAYGMVVYSIISFLGITSYYFIKKHRMITLNVTGFQIKGEFGDVLLNEKETDTYNLVKSSFKGNNSGLLNEKLKSLSLKRFPEIFDFLDRNVDLNSFDNSYSVIFKSDNISNIDFLPDTSIQFLLNIEKLNRVPDINEYLAEANNKLMKDGIFAGNFETIYLRHQTYLKRYPYYFAQLFYFLDFFWNRVLSNMIIFKKIQFSLINSNKNSFSLAEGLGRLYYAGFEVLHLKIIEDKMFFISRKEKEPVKDIVPSTGLLFKMKRLGKNGENITVYKLRTMYPYAEYLQEFIYDKFELQEGGKFKNDFRITFWGKVLRKLWLDELPMLYNFFKGELKLVGCRPLSQHYFNLYKEELKQKRLKYKPGLIPPFYADIPKTLDEIMESEDKYLTLYDKNPISTDIKYFAKCIGNILFKGARSS